VRAVAPIPVDLLSEEELKATLERFKWTRVSTLTPTQAKKARIQFRARASRTARGPESSGQSVNRGRALFRHDRGLRGGQTGAEDDQGGETMRLLFFFSLFNQKDGKSHSKNRPYCNPYPVKITKLGNIKHTIPANDPVANEAPHIPYSTILP